MEPTVVGSLVAPLVQLVRIWVLWAQGHGFEPRKEHPIFVSRAMDFVYSQPE